MKRKLDFIIKEDSDSRLVFRFYPRQSHCHGFTEKSPETWDEVYKVYYAYSILYQSKWSKDEQWDTEVLFEERCDECSIIQEIGYRLVSMSKGIFNYENEDADIAIHFLDNELRPFGMGTSWTIHKGKRTDFKTEEEYCYYVFSLWNYFNCGFRFELNENRIKEFGEYLIGCCEYMLAHSEGI